MTKRNADWVWRWLGATSPGRISCRPADRLWVIDDGVGVGRSDAQAFKWYLKATEAKPDENPAADRDEDRDEAAVWTNLGNMYHWGRGTKKDDVKARAAYLKAAQLDNPVAQNNLAYMLERGLGGPKDAAGAADWYHKAAEKGFQVAQGNLALIYESGRGVKRDDGEAQGWYRKAALQGNTFAQYRLGPRGYRHPAMLQDAARAVRLVRQWAAEWKIEPNRIGIMGSSAGGHLASTLLTHWDNGQPDAADPIRKQ